MTKLFVFTSRFLVKSVLVMLLASCAATPPQSALPLTHAEEPVVTAPPAVQPLQTGLPQLALPNVELSPDLLYRLLVAEVAGQRGQFTVSEDAYTQLARNTRDPRLSQRAAQIAVLAGDPAKTLDALQLWVQQDPDNLDARQVLVTYLIRGKQADAALPHLEKLVAAYTAQPAQSQSVAILANPDFSMAAQTATPQGAGYMLVTALLGREEDRKLTLGLMARLAAAHPDNPDAQYAYAALAQNTGDLKVARSAIDQALTLHPGWPKGIAARARIMLAQGENDQALAYLKDAVEQNPSQSALRLSYARVLVDAKQPEAARAQFAAVAKQSPDSPEVLLSLGLLSLQINQLDDARKYLMQTASLGKFNNEASYYLGQIAEAGNQPDEAISWYKAVQEGEAYLDAQLRTVNLLAKKGDTEAARAQLHTIHIQDSRQANLISMAEADLLSDQKKYAEAMAIYNDALSADPQDNNLLYGRALLAAKTDQLDVMEKDLRDILSREPDNARALNALGYTLADRTTRYQEALGYIKHALQLNPQDPSTLDSIGWVQYRLGNKKDAINYLQIAYKLGFDADIAAHLGEVLWSSGDHQGARRIWDEALKAEPQSEALLSTMKRLQVQ